MVIELWLAIGIVWYKNLTLKMRVSKTPPIISPKKDLSCVAVKFWFSLRFYSGIFLIWLHIKMFAKILLSHWNIWWQLWIHTVSIWLFVVDISRFSRFPPFDIQKWINTSMQKHNHRTIFKDSLTITAAKLRTLLSSFGIDINDGTSITIECSS